MTADNDTLEEYARYFPKFVWVLRDFSLQLVDEYGDDITSNQYLETALEHQEGFGQDVDFKNRIRELIKGFFQKRNCYTLVRPLTSEEGLNRLADCKLENLRPEFVEEALKLRNSMLLDANIKVIEDKRVNGEVLGGILRAYVDTINSGVIPNIESAWAYVTQSQATKLLDKCIQQYRFLVNNRLKKLIPTTQLALKEAVSEFRSTILAEFRQGSFLKADENAQYETTLLQKMKEEKQSLYLENDNKFEEVLTKAMQNNYKEVVYNQVLADKVGDTKELLGLLKAFKTTFEGLDPDGPRKLERLYKFLFGKSCESFMIYCSNREGQLAEQLAERMRESKATEERLREDCKRISDGKAKIENDFKALELRFHDANFENEKLKESAKFAREELVAFQSESSAKREEERLQGKRRLDEAVRKAEEYQKQYKELEALFVKQKSDFQIEAALLNQKVEFYTNIEKELTEQKNRLLARQKQMEDEFSARLAKANQDFEIRLKEKADEVLRLRDNRFAIEEELKAKQTYNESMCSEFVDKEEELRAVIATLEKSVGSLKSQIAGYEKQGNEHSQQEKLLNDRIVSLEAVVRSGEEKLRESHEKLSALQTSMETALAVGHEKTVYLEQKVADLTSENDELRRRKDSNLQLLEMKNLPKVDLNSQLQEVRANYDERLKKLLADFEAEKDDLNKQWGRQLEDIEEKVKDLKSEKENLLASRLSLIQELEGMRSRVKSLEEKVSFLEGTQSETLQEKLALFEQQMKRAADEREAINVAKEEEIERARRTFEEHMTNMQVVFDGEKNRLESRLSEEKLKFEMLLNEQIDELEKKRAEEVAACEEENELLTLELQSQEARTKMTVQKLENEVASLKTKLEASERRVAELSSTLDKELTTERNKMKLALANAEQERGVLAEKLNSLRVELNAKNLEIFQARQQIESHVAALAKAASDKTKDVSDLTEEVSELKARIEALTAEKHGVAEELINAKISLNKDLALKSQKVEFLENRIADLTNSFEFLQRESEDKIKTVKQEIEIERESAAKVRREELALWESRYEEKKRAMKEVEAIFTAKVADLEKARYVLQEKLASAELKRDEWEKKSAVDAQRYEADAKRVKETYQTERKDMVAEIDSLRKEKYELEITLAETVAKLDKDRAVSESKISFLELQIRKLKADLSESQASFDAMFQKFHQFRVSDKEETEASHNTYVISLEQRYTAQIQDLKDQHKTIVESLKEKVRVYEKEIRRLEQLNYDNLNNRHGSGVFQEKKIAELLENEKQLQDELVRVKGLMEKSAVGLQKEFERERESFKKRLLDQELKLKKLETEKNLMVFEQEKQKTKWNIEKDHLISSKTEFLESLDRLKKQKEQLARENEKLKSDLRLAKKSSLGNSLFTFVKNKSEVMSMEKSGKGSNEYLGGTQGQTASGTAGYREDSDEGD